MIAVLFLMAGADGLPFEQDIEDAIDAEIRRRVPDGDMSGLSKAKRSDKPGKKRSGAVGTRIARASGDKTQRAVRAVGPVHWLEAGTRAHVTGAGRLSGNQLRLTKSGKYRKGQRKLMSFGGVGHPVLGPIRVSGMRAGHTWSKGVRRAVPKAAAVFNRRSVVDVFEPFQ